MMHKTILISLCIAIHTLGFGQNSVWQIGQRDGSGGEFALAPDKYSEYISSGFGSDNKIFVVGSNTTNEFAYALAGPYADWGGYSYWAGWTMVRLPIYFGLNNLQKDQTYSLNISLLDVSPDDAMVLRAEVNGHFHDTELTQGRNRDSYKGKLTDLTPAQITLPIAGTELNNGTNKVVLQLLRGNYVLFDAIDFTGPSSTIAVTPLNNLLISASCAQFEQIERGKKVQSVLLDVRNEGQTQELTVTIGKSSFTKQSEKGHTVFELNVPAVRKKTLSDVCVKVGGQIVYEGVVERSAQRLVEPSDYVDQFSGSSGSRWMIGPGPWMPFGMVKIMPDNEQERWKSGYEYQIENIMGFSHIHEWTMGGLLMMPTVGELKTEPGSEKYPDEGYRSRINKKTERGEIGYYSVDLTDYNIKAELTATTRASLQRYTFPKSDSSRILVDLIFPTEYSWSLKDAHISRVSDREIEGWAHSFCNSTGYLGDQDYIVHFVMQFDKSFESMGGWIKDSIYKDTYDLSRADYPFADSKEDIADVGAFINFKTHDAEQISVRTGISLVSVENARLNLTEEMAEPFGWNFDAVVQNQRKEWNALFDRVKIQSDDYLIKRKFYTNLYRSISPRTIWNDVNGQWVDMDENVQNIEEKGRNVYGSDAYWGMHWNLNHLYNMIYPEYMSNWLYTFEQTYKIGGWLPIGNPGMEYFRVMVGAPAIPMITSAWQHGIRDFDSELLYKAIVHEQTALPEFYAGGGQVGNEDYPDYLTKGYVPLYKGKRPNEKMHSYVSNTHEYAYQDYAAAQFAKALGKGEYEMFIKRSDNWKNLFDPQTGFTRPRDENGVFMKDFSPYYAPGFCEGSAWQYTWYVPHNVRGLVKLMGEDRFVNRLDEALRNSELVYFNALGDNVTKFPINHGNETNMQSSSLFNYTNSPWLSQKWSRSIQEKYYGTMGPRDAYPGDEDQGQMSAWYVLSSIGMFEMDGGCAADPQVEICSPRFEKVTIQLSDKYYGGKQIEVVAEGASRERCYIESMSFNGKPIHTPFISWSELKGGGKLEIKMSDQPNKNWWK